MARRLMARHEANNAATRAGARLPPQSVQPDSGADGM